MDKIKFKNHIVNISHCNDNAVYNNYEFNKAIDYLFSVSGNHLDESQLGQAESTVNLDFNISNLPEFFNFYKWIVYEIDKIHDELDIDKGNISFTRTWINRMYKGCEGKEHLHPSNLSGVAIFYTKAPKESSDLILIDGDDTMNIKVNEGMLIIHRPDLPHAISKHLSDLPRECIISEFVIM